MSQAPAHRSPRSRLQRSSSATPEISRFCQTVRRISPSPNVCARSARPRICSGDSRPSFSATPTQFRPLCFCGCTPIWASLSKVGRGAIASAGTRCSGWPSFSSTAFRNFSKPQASSTYFSRALLRLVRSPCSMKTRTIASAIACRLLRLQDDAGIAREIAVAGDAAERETIVDAGLDAVPVQHLDRLEGDVVGLFQHRDPARAVIGDIEFARQAIQRTVVEDVEVPLARMRPRVQQLLRIDAGGRRAGDVADVVGAGAARPQAEILDRLDHVGRVLRLDLAQLQIRARRHMRIGTAEFFGDVGDAGKLPVLENAVRNAQAAHVGVLRRRHVEQAVVAPAEIVRQVLAARCCAPASPAADRHRTDARRA